MQPDADKDGTQELPKKITLDFKHVKMSNLYIVWLYFPPLHTWLTSPAL